MSSMKLIILKSIAKKSELIVLNSNLKEKKVKNTLTVIVSKLQDRVFAKKDSDLARYLKI